MSRYSIALLAAILAACVITTPALASTAQTDIGLLSQNFTQFDQHTDTGWRLVAFQRKYLEAAALIETYQKQNAQTLLPWQKASLAYHLGVVYSLANKRQTAIYWFRRALAPKLLGNPAYVKAHIAFEAGDRAGLLQARRKITGFNPSTTQTEDLEETNSMIEYFGQPFEAAFGALNCIKHAPPNADTWHSFCTVMWRKYGALYRKHQLPE